MEVVLHRVDLLHTGALAQGTLCVLPQGKKKQQKVAIGDDTGSLHVFFMKRGEVQTEWKQAVGDREIASVVLQLGKDKLFVGCGQSIHGFTRKGKEFVKIRTNLAETINHLFVHENVIWTGGECIMNIYDQCKDFGSCVVKDKINDLRCAPLVQGDMLSAILACQDKCIRVYKGDRPHHEFPVEGPGTALGFYSDPDPETRTANDPMLMLYGTEQGMVGLCKLDAKHMQKTASLTDRQMRPGMTSPAAATRRARVCTLHTADVLKSGALDFLVGRDDGNFEVWSLGENSASAFTTGAGGDQLPPTLCFETCLQESIQSMDSGNVTGSEHTEVLLTTYGGKVLAFTPEGAARDPTGAAVAQMEDRGEGNANARRPSRPSPQEDAMVKAEKEKRHKALQMEVDKLKQELEKERQTYQKLSGEQIAVQTTTKVKHRFNLNSEEACYILTLDCQSPLELVSLRADVDIDLLDHEGTGAILSRSKGDPSNPLLATYRMQEPGSRFEIKLRTVEGLNGNISCFVLPQTNPKTAHLVTLAVKPLSLHEKISEEPPDIADVPMNELRLVGPFTIEYMHQWISLCVNELPSRPTDDEMVICYRSTFVGTLLHGRYTKGSATFRSDSITTISVLKDMITREATARKIHLKIDVEVQNETFPRLLELIHPKLEIQHLLTQQVRMVEPLREVQLQEPDTKFLAPELQQVLEHGTEIQQQFELQPQRLAFLHNIVISAYRHKWRLRGYQGVEHRTKELQKLLDDYNVEHIATFFDEPVD